MVTAQLPPCPGHIQPKHWQEWLSSCVEPGIIAANVRSMQGQDVYEWLMEDLWEVMGSHASQYATAEVTRYLSRYESLADGGGWCCRGLDPMADWGRMRWGQFKANVPRIDGQNGRVIKYEPLPGQPNRAFFLAKPGEEGYWQKVQNNPAITIVLTEGAKKAGALLSQGYAAIALPGVNAGYRVKDEQGSPIKPELLPDLARFAQPGRKWILAFDQDAKNATRRKVEKALAKQGLLLVDAGGTVSLASWNGAEGKGIDDFMANRGPEAVAEILAQTEELDVDLARVLLAGDESQRLEALVRQYAAENNPFKKALIEAQIGSDFKIRGTQLKELAYYAAPKSPVEFVPMAMEACDILDEIQKRSQTTGWLGTPCGFHDLDRMTQGFQGGDLMLLAGRPGFGKSSLAAQMCYQIAKDQGLSVPIFSLEMSRRQLLYRQLAIESGIPLSSLRSGRIADNQWEGLGESVFTATAPPVFVANDFSSTVEEMRYGLTAFQREHGRIGLVMIDYLQLMAGKGDNRVQALSEITRELKLIAMDLDVPILALSQLSRGVEGRTNKRPTNSDLRDSGALEQDADIIMMLYREEMYDEETPDKGIAEVIVTKHRNGPTGTVKLLFEQELTRFRNLAA